MKRIENLHSRKTRVGGQPVEFGGAFDETVVSAMQNGLNRLSNGNSAFRRLTKEEKSSLKDVEFKERDELVRKRLASLGVGTSIGAIGAGGIKLVDLARRSEWVAEKSADLDQYIEMLAEVAQYFV